MVDLIVCGLGPAGRAVAHRALARGLSVIAIDPRPERPWQATYAVWRDELPAWVDPSVVATVSRPRARALGEHRIERDYGVLDTAALHTCLTLEGARVLADRVLAVDHAAGTVRTAAGAVLAAARVVDARGLGRAPGRAEQTAYGVVTALGDLARAGGPLFMDWHADNGAAPDDPPSFLYAVPLDGERALLEETCLAGRPALGLDVLRDRLHTRLRARGIALSGAEPVERVRFPVEGGRPGGDRFGAAGALTHPATGYSVAAALAAAGAAAEGAPLWPPRARAVLALRRAGLRTLLALPPRDLPAFFDAFFALPVDRQRAYLSGRDDLAGTAAAMSALFARLPARLRRHVVTAVGPGLRAGR
ncbi:lycopene cyclase family protein [Nocardia thailandica]